MERAHAGGAATFDVTDPATGAVVGTVADHGPHSALQALGEAHDAFPSWSATPPRRRSEILTGAHRGMIAAKDRLAALIVAENGKSRADAEAEVGYAAEFFRWYAEEAVRIPGHFGTAPGGGVRNVVSRAPVGVAALITPWNFPAAMATRKLAPALAAGCTAVLKPAAETPLTALAIEEILLEAGVPEGAVRVVPTTAAAPVVSAWIADRRVRKLSFTGSTGVGRTLLSQCADRVLNTSMELGGNAPFVVAEDADIDAAVQGAMIAKFRNSGQACTAANRFYVHRRVADAFVERFGRAVEALKVGPGEQGADIGPVISERQADGIRSLVESAVADGARVAHRAEVSPDLPRTFVAPTVLTGVAPDAAVVREEVFGPVAPVLVWEDEDELVEQANATEYGLASYVYAGSADAAMRIGERLEAGMVGINRGLVSDPSAPFGGVKQSGLGREGADLGLDEYLEPTYFSVAWS
ncbi:NAD-dependent succinate-semialdehyde dehydrogenase [Nocardiopsis sp. HNM0947]|uniref:NAD-dependent succinate-semialdehyde dehydrogenase n=1 Tax=Nocardiopsis coralli TaxID=2772213 RepID=A0ABR9PA87_9ACTN|nr:NAD-dependent succinate-semialdehyde dehydrogenase [Nocardiopsis coralli]MBE3000749.1 NAD-dependent succinate-semialdehyde dehydrogenase [Nocardiopsis coralli]